MFQFPKPRGRRKRVALLTSFILHCAVLYLLVHRTPIFVQPSLVAWGHHGVSETVVYFSRTSEQEPKKRARIQIRNQETIAQKRQTEPAKSGSENGSTYQGFASGRNAVPALPQVFPDPVVYPWQLSGLQGDVIVEVTIDEQGNVVETRLLQSLKQEIDEKVIATVRNWRFRPATVDGVAISSRQDVHFHFPS